MAETAKKSKYSKYAEIKRIADDFLYDSKVMTEEESTAKNASYAYCTRIKGSNMYRIVRNFFARSSMYFMHEFGHIYFGHMKFDQIKLDNIKAKLEANEAIVNKHIIARTLNEKKKVYDQLGHELLNIAMDFEVNSKFFTKEEEALMVRDLNSTYFNIMAASSKSRAQAWAKKYKANPKTTGLRPMLVTDYGFPRELSYEEYVLLMFQDLEKFLRTYVALGVPGNGGKGTVSASDWLQSDARKVASDANEGTGSSEPGEGRSNGGSGVERGNTESVDKEHYFETAKRFIIENSIEHLQFKRQNMLYNYNRGKTKDVMIPKSISASRRDVGNIYAIVDVSGSVDWKNVNKMIKTFREISSMVGSKSKVIFWDTKLEKMIDFKNIKEVKTKTGGTELSTAIKFAKGLSNKKNDRIFVISDFYDDLKGWNDAIAGYRGLVYGINYQRNSSEDFPELSRMKKILKIA